MLKLSSPLTLALSILLAVSVAHASRRIGNGGNVVACDGEYGKTSPRSVELLDIAESRARNANYTLDLGDSSLRADEKLEVFFKRLERLSPKRASFYRAKLKIFKDNLTITRDIPTVDDIGPIGIRPAPNCSIFQAAIQYVEPFENTSHRLFLDAWIYQMMSEETLATLYIHELVTAEASSSGLNESVGYRPFVALLASNRLATLSLKDFVQATLDAGLIYYEANGLQFVFDRTISGNPYPIFQGDTVIEGAVYPDSYVDVRDRATKRIANHVYIRDRARFYDDGSLKAAISSRSQPVAFDNGLIAEVKAGTLLSFNEQGLASVDKAGSGIIRP